MISKKTVRKPCGFWLISLCFLLSIIVTGCASITGMSAERENYRFILSQTVDTIGYLREKHGIKLPAEYIRYKMGEPDFAGAYRDMERFVTNEDLRKEIEETLAVSLAFGLELEEVVKELEKLRSDGYNIWFYDEYGRFRRVGFFPSFLCYFLIDPTGKVVAGGATVTRKPFEKIRH